MTIDNPFHDRKTDLQSMYPIGGTWFRRERERIAIGRPVVAKHLGVPIGRLARLERNNEAVPCSWWILLPALGFVNPWRPQPSLSASAIKEAPKPSASPTLASTAGRAKGLLPAPSPARGLWLRSRRLDMGLSLQTVSKALGLTTPELGTLEWQDLLVPPAWLSTLATFGFCRPATSADPGPLISSYGGTWLRRERERKKLALEICAIPLGVTARFLDLVETHDWPLTPEWVPILAKLGFADESLISFQIRRDEATDAKVAAPAGKIVHANTEPCGSSDSGSQSSQSAASPIASNLVALEIESPLDGPWLCKERERLGLSLSDLKKALGLQLSTVQSAESRTTQVPKGWLSTLASLGFRLPPRLSIWNPPAKDELRLSGGWLAKARERSHVSVVDICHELNVDLSTLKLIEDYDRPLPAAWLSGLKQLGLSVLDRPVIPGGARLPTPCTCAQELPAANEKRPKSAPPSVQHRQGLVEAAFTYRLRMGRSMGKPAFEVLVGIVEDVKQACLDAAITYEVLDATLRGLRLQRSS